jgi:PilZ domain
MSMPPTLRWLCDDRCLHADRRGLRFSFDASAEVVTGSAPADTLRARATELSLRGCFLDVAGRFAEREQLQVRIFHGGDFFEASAEVIYVRKGGVGVIFGEMNPHFRQVLQKWVLAELDKRMQPGKSFRNEERKEE